MPYLGGTVYCANAGWAWQTNKEPPPTRLSSKRRCFTIARVESLASRRTFERCNEVQTPTRTATTRTAVDLGCRASDDHIFWRILETARDACWI